MSNPTHDSAGKELRKGSFDEYLDKLSPETKFQVKIASAVHGIQIRYYGRMKAGDDTVGDDKGQAEINALIHQAEQEAVKKELTKSLEFATRVQANGEFVPIQNGILPWLKDRLANLDKEITHE